MQLSYLRGRKVVERVRHKGARFRGKHMNMTYAVGAPRNISALLAIRGTLFVGTAASTKLDKSAVKRNRMRRRCREALRISALGRKELPVCQLIISPRSSSLDCNFDALLQDAESFLDTLQNSGMSRA